MTGQKEEMREKEKDEIEEKKKEEEKLLHTGGRDQSKIVQEVLADLKRSFISFQNNITAWQEVITQHGRHRLSMTL